MAGPADPARRIIARSAEAALIAVPRFDEGAATTASLLSAPEAARHLLAQVQNLQRVGLSDALQVIGTVVSRSTAITVTYGDAREAVASVLDAVRRPENARTFTRYDTASRSLGTIGPAPTPGTAALCFTDGALLVRSVTGEMATTDTIGAAIWPLVDGTRPLDVLVDELADTYGESRDRVLTECSRWLTRLAALGFVVAD